MSRKNLINTLRERGLVTQISNENTLEQILAQQKIVLYCGFDPTSNSLHVGHLIPLLCLKHFQNAGHKPIILVGGATGLIGDPSFKIGERKLNTKNTVDSWVASLSLQIVKFLDFQCSENSAIIINNYSWFYNMNIVHFLRHIGKNFSVNQMINKEIVKKRLQTTNQGLSFTEFAYNLLQAYDFAYLNANHHAILQIGGSDQWGNITSGIDLSRRLNKTQVFGMTLPLLTKYDGTKFGKTEGGTVWLDPQKTSPYQFYQFWMTTVDSDVYRFLKIFTFMSIDDIEALQKKDNSSNQAPSAQGILAALMTKLVHGEQGLTSARRITHSLFYGKITDLTEQDIKQLIQDGIHTITLKVGQDLQQALVDTLLATSRSQARQLITAKSISINGHLQTGSKYIFDKIDHLFGQYTVLCRGKKNYRIISWITDNA
ncbi:tyrosine--tRNA ligase [Candidatus Erwinia haradaeae]|uniref:Tyrosine--tRNA ligase n=1 Tax=Candidatus Erwinia haradaeae TaxID=1922217 RepID=A0A451DAD0_9GAMM|nr:tyrosine--tRNA ligase [Candidatus Erwinia haradaeae]VFP83167.1 Tyrosine--tRNA ligase [Candidatus Erwinia haradaeae]